MFGLKNGKKECQAERLTAPRASVRTRRSAAVRELSLRREKKKPAKLRRHKKNSTCDLGIRATLHCGWAPKPLSFSSLTLMKLNPKGMKAEFLISVTFVSCVSCSGRSDLIQQRQHLCRRQKKIAYINIDVLREGFFVQGEKNEVGARGARGNGVRWSSPSMG